MKWYDYLACFCFAGSVSAGLVSGNIFVLTFGVLSYMLYEDMRKGANNADSDG